MSRVAAWFLAPAEKPTRVAASPLGAAARVVVLGGPDAVAALAASIALALRATTGLIALWQAEYTPTAGLATRAAARLAARLTARDLPTLARGRLAWMALPDDTNAAAAAIRRASAVVEGPLVTGLAGARPAALDDLVAEHDMAVVAAAPETALARVALAGLAARGIATTACPPPRRGLARRLALAGLAAPRALPDLYAIADVD